MAISTANAPGADLYVGGAGGGAGSCVVIVDIPGTGPSASVSDPHQVVVSVPLQTQVVSINSGVSPVVALGGGGTTVGVTVQRPVVDVNASTTPITIEGDGLQGPPGAPGASGAGYTHVQPTPSATWIINHNLGFNPGVELLTVGGVEFEAEVAHTSVNQTVVTLLFPIAGSARLT